MGSGDRINLILAEPKALIGFAGQRVIRDTIKQELPEGFQTAEFALAHGLIDAIVERAEMRRALKTLLRLHCGTPPHPEEEDEVLRADAQAPLSEKDRKKLERHAQRGLRRAGLKGAPLRWRFPTAWPCRRTPCTPFFRQRASLPFCGRTASGRPRRPR